jgi:hypothetical protein
MQPPSRPSNLLADKDCGVARQQTQRLKEQPGWHELDDVSQRSPVFARHV